MKMNKQIKLEGEILRAISPLGYEWFQRFAGPMSTRVMSLLKLRGLNCEKINIERPDGTCFRACVMRGKKTEGETIGVLWLHGGGYVLGAPEMAMMSFPRILIENANCVIVSPDYTLSSIAPYPAALEDAYTSLLWFKEHKDELGVTTDRIVVGGESAGGGLTAGLSLYARDKGEDIIGFTMPLYPMLDDRVTKTSSDNHAPVWNTKANKSAWRIYLGDKVMNNNVPIYAAPARCENLTGFPPAISTIGTIEPFYDEVITFFDRLKTANIKCDLKEFEGGYHAFDMMAPYAKISKDANTFLLKKFQEYSKLYLHTES